MAVSVLGILILGAIVVGVPILLLVLVLAGKGRPAAPQAGPECPSCGGWTVPQANYCQWCGRTLGTGGGK